MNFFDRQFNRKFSTSMYKDLRIGLGRMTFLKDFVNDTRGDLYPILEKSGDCEESIKHNRYILERGSISRMLCQFFPFATYSVTFSSSEGSVGFTFKLPSACATIALQSGSLSFNCGDHSEVIDIDASLIQEESTLIISCRPGAFDVYLQINGRPEHLKTFYEDSFKDSNLQSNFSNGYAFLTLFGSVCVKEAVSYIDNGISIADIRPIKYENGEAIYENGKIYFTASVRMQEGAFQGIFSFTPSTDQIDMTGAVFCDCGDGRWRNYLASVILYNRMEKQWLMWTSSFEHKHVLAHASFDGDPRFGVNVIDVELMEFASEDSSFTDFLGFKGDEDPDLLYDTKSGRWLMAICRLDPDTRSYVYAFFESDSPLKNFKYIGRGLDGAETGGSFVNIDGELSFVCGNDFKKRSEYRIYQKGQMQCASFTYPDGGFRGWGSLFSIKAGSRQRYFWLTFDRHNGSSYNWSYGNLYCFEMIK